MDISQPSFFQRLRTCIKTATPKALKTAWWLIRITLPVTFLVFILNYTGILAIVSAYLSPFFRYLGLPGQSAFVLITSMLANIYSSIAVLSTLQMPVRDGVILASMCLVAHAFLIETAVLRKTGSSAVRMILLRIITSLVAGVLLNQILPPMEGTVKAISETVAGGFREQFIAWASGILALCARILLLVWSLLFLQRIMVEFGWLELLSRNLNPLMKAMGLPASVTFSWIVANVVGLAYGSAIMIEESEQGRMNREDADLLNHHIAVSHSQLEDPLLFLTIGLPIHWLMWPRFLLAVIVVWLRRIEISYIRAMGRRQSRV